MESDVNEKWLLAVRADISLTIVHARFSAAQEKSAFITEFMLTFPYVAGTDLITIVFSK